MAGNTAAIQHVDKCKHKHATSVFNINTACGDVMAGNAASDYPPTFTTTFTFTAGHLRLPAHLHHHFQFHTSLPPITHLFWPTLPFSHMASFNYLPILTTTSICTALYSWLPIHTYNPTPKLWCFHSSHLWLHTTPLGHFQLANQIDHHFDLPAEFQCCHRGYPKMVVSVLLLLWIFRNIVLIYLPPGTTPYISGWWNLNTALKNIYLQYQEFQTTRLRIRDVMIMRTYLVLCYIYKQSVHLAIQKIVWLSLQTIHEKTKYIDFYFYFLPCIIFFRILFTFI